jgi:hypothetical protein
MSPLGRAKHFTEFLATPPEIVASKFALSITALIEASCFAVSFTSILEIFWPFVSEELDFSEEPCLDQSGSSDSQILTKK